MNWVNKNVLVTGAGGFIGSHLTERLVGLGAKVRAFVRYNSRNDRGLLECVSPEVTKEIEVIMGDLRDAYAVMDGVRKAEIIFHLGALIAIPYSYIHPLEVTESNVLGTLNVLMAAKQHNISKVIHTSTSEVYGTAIRAPISESHPLQAQSPYAATKIGADKIAESFYKSYGLPVATIRPFNTYGPRQSARAVIPTIITQALTRDKVFLGSTYPTRDLTYIDDIVDAFVKMAEVSETVGEVVNVGSGVEISIDELADKIILIVGRKVEVILDRARIRPPESEIERLVADTTKAREILKWESKVALEEGLERTIEWFKESIDRYKIDIYNI